MDLESLPDSQGKTLMLSVGTSRANILKACRLEGIKKIHLILTEDLFPKSPEGEKQLQLLFKALNYNLEGVAGEQLEYTFDWIKGPESSMKDCRDSILENLDNTKISPPDIIFVTGSTLLIQATIVSLFPDAKLVSLRRDDFIDLSDNSLISKSKPIDINEYASLHGMKFEGNQILLNGKKIGPKFSQVKMVRGIPEITWIKSYDNKQKQDKKEHQKIGSAVKKITNHCGITTFRFKAFGYVYQALNSMSRDIVTRTPTVQDFTNLDINESDQISEINVIHENRFRCIIRLSGLAGIFYGSKKDLETVSYLVVSGELDRKGRMILLIDEEE